MRIDHVHFFVDDAAAKCAWFQARLGWSVVRSPESSPPSLWNDPHIQTQFLTYRGLTFALSSPLTRTCRVANYLRDYAPGVADIAVRLTNLKAFLAERPALQILERQQNWARIAGWGGLTHTLIEEDGAAAESAESLDHLVLNVPTGQLQTAVQFYQHLFDLTPQQRFQIQTQQSGLHSQVLYSPKTQLYFNINEPASPNSQIQVFLDANRGAGIQHLALKAAPLVSTVAELRRRGLPLLPIAARYYGRVRDRLQNIVPIAPEEWQQIIGQQILVDGSADKPGSLLLQIFSKPIFDEPTFFLSLLSGVSRLRALERAIFWRYIRPSKQSWSGGRLMWS